MLVERLNIQTNKIKQLKSKGLDTLEDILWFFPRKYNDFRFETGILPKEEKGFSMHLGSASSLKRGCLQISVTSNLKSRKALIFNV